MNPTEPSQEGKASIASGGSSSNVVDTIPTPDVPTFLTFSSASVMSHWDPLRSPDWDSVKPQSSTLIRIKKDIMEIYRDPPPGVVVLPSTEDITRIYAVITGPFDTPYEGGYFLFLIRCPPDYPIKCPRVRLLTTGNQSVRFNPNFYKNGKVCLSILGTWSGPGWSPAQSLASVLVSIQSLMTENPYHNEPGFANERVAGDSKRYADCIRHETIRVAVCDMVEHGSPFCEQAKEIVESSFLEYYEYYITTCTENMKDDGKPFEDPFGCNKGHYAYKSLRSKIESLKLKLSRGTEGSNGEMSASNSSS